MLSTVSELRKNIKHLRASLDDVELTENITDGDKVVYDDLSKIVDWDDIEGLTYVPRVINRLSQYQAAMITIVRTWDDDETTLDGDTEGSNHGYKYWEKMYGKLLDQLKLGDIQILDNSNDTISEEYARRPGIGRII